MRPAAVNLYIHAFETQRTAFPELTLMLSRVVFSHINVIITPYMAVSPEINLDMLYKMCIIVEDDE